MALHQDESGVIKLNDRATKAEEVSRRKFIHSAAMGAAAIGATIALKGSGVLAQTGESGQVEVDAIMLSYVASPLGSIASTTNTYQKSHATTIKLTATQNTALTLSASVSTFGNFSIGGSNTYRQTNSTSATNAITLRRSVVESFTTPAPGAIGNTVFVGLLKPEMQMDGFSGGFSFRFLKAVDKFGVKHSDLQANGAGGQFKPATVTSFLSKYVTDPALLVGPRFKLKSSILLSAGVVNTFSLTKATGSGFSTSKSATTSVEITRKVTVGVPMVFSATFEVGFRIEVQQTALQEFTTDKILTCATTLNRSSLGVNKIYWDRVFKTFVVIDLGPPAAQTKVQGVVRDTFGSPIANGVVSLQAGTVEYMAVTDSNGNYSIKTAAADTIPSGTYPLVVGNDSTNIATGSGSAFWDFWDIDPWAAQNHEINGEAINLN
ncbi:MAG: carboxypeptidase-like regulatory domain-containing protein [Acidobacteriota bacterium]